MTLDSSLLEMEFSTIYGPLLSKLRVFQHLVFQHKVLREKYIIDVDILIRFKLFFTRGGNDDKAFSFD